MISSIFDLPAVSRMGWALLHFLWQGIVIAAALKGALMLVKQSYSRLRYGLALACLFLMAVSPLLVLCRHDRRNVGSQFAQEAAGFEMASAPSAASVPSAMSSRPELFVRTLQIAEPLLPWIVAFWLLGMALLFMKTIGGVLEVHILKRKESAPCATNLAESFRLLAARAGVTGVRVRESDCVSVPTVAGWLRPVVLLPRSVPERMDRPLLEGLLAHEFAHIRRYDSLINLLQIFIECLLFFHPAVWWVTKRVRAEREACCDDAAVAVCGNTLVYVRALSQAEHFRTSAPVMALSGSPLLQRIRRLTEMKSSRVHQIAAPCVALLALSFIIAAAAASFLFAAVPLKDSSTIVISRQEKKSSLREEAGKYFLLCGITMGRMDKATGKPVFFPPPAPKDDKERVGGCYLFDNSKTGPSRLVQGEFEASKLIHKVDPVYPDSAVKEHIGIRVLLRIQLDEQGVVTNAAIAKSQTVPPDTDREGKWVGGVRTGVVMDINSATINAVKQWKYTPTLLNGKAVPVTTNVTVTFTFSKDGSPRILTFIG